MQLESLIERPEPIDEKYINQIGLVSKNTICQELREIYNLIDNEEAKLKIRVAMAMAKKITNRLIMYRNGEISWKCEKCGKCCISFELGISLAEAHKKEESLISVRGFPTDKPLVVRIDHRCQHLNKDNLCNIYASRPEECRLATCNKKEEING